jgi:SAM-dependent methyltransferase
MADADRQRWNERYRAETYDFTPARWLRDMEPALREHPPGARALDIACGGGRHAIYLAELGYAVDALDISEVGLGQLQAELTRRAVAGQVLPVQTQRVDLERAPLPVDTYDLILDAHYLERALLAPMRLALRPGGRLIVHTFLFVPGGPMSERLHNPAFALQPGELTETFGQELELLDLYEAPASEAAHLLGRRRPPSRQV